MFGVGIIALLMILSLSLIITRVATVALSLTGLSYETARFQSRSAYTGTGFTTREAENIVNHPVRRRIIMLLMMMRSGKLLTIITSLFLSFLDAESHEHAIYRLVVICGVVVLLCLVSRSRIIEGRMRGVIGWALSRWTTMDVRDYGVLLRLSAGYSVTELNVKEDDWLAGKAMLECRLTDEGVQVLGIARADGSYVGTPRPETEIHANDTLIIYGHIDGLNELDQRRADSSGDQAHEQARHKQQDELQQQNEQETRRS